MHFKLTHDLVYFFLLLRNIPSYWCFSIYSICCWRISLLLPVWEVTIDNVSSYKQSITSVCIFRSVDWIPKATWLNSVVKLCSVFQNTYLSKHVYVTKVLMIPLQSSMFALPIVMKKSMLVCIFTNNCYFQFGECNWQTLRASFVLFCFLAVLGLELGASRFLAGVLPLEPLCQPCFAMGFFRIGSQELFTWAGFEPGSSWPLLFK
jgi:hypothetical protein